MKKILSIHTLLCLLLVIGIGVSVYTYFTSLSRYSTSDQYEATLQRMKAFLANADSVNFSNGSNLSNVIVAIPAHILEKKISPSKTAELAPESTYTEIYPFTLIQVILSLLLLFYCVLLSGKLLELKIKDDLIYFLLIAFVLLNFPMLKGIVKVLKYDALSLLCSVIAILNFLLYTKAKKNLHLVLAGVFSAMAFIEKDTSFAIIGLIFMYELIHIALAPAKEESSVMSFLKFTWIYCGSFAIAAFIFVPSIWAHPVGFFALFSSLSQYFKSLTVAAVLFMLILFLLFLFLVRRVVSMKQKDSGKKTIVQKNKKNIQSKEREYYNYYYAAFFVGLIIFLSALFFQDNNMITINTANQTTLDKIRSKHLFVSPESAGWSYTTMDNSKWLTSVKVFYNHFRIFVYTAPEAPVVLFFSAFILLGIMSRKKKPLEFTGTLIGLLAFGIVILAAYSFLLMPPEAKYDLLPSVLFILFAVLTSIHFLKNLNNSNYKLMSVVIISLCTIRPMIKADPAHFNYFSLLRSTTKENSDFLDMNKYCSWTWVGWGESTYSCFNYVEKNSTGTQKIMYDYFLPFYISKNIQAEHSPRLTPYANFNNDILKNFLKEVSSQNISYMIISKNVAFRDALAHFILTNYPQQAVYVDRVCGVSYAWVYRVDELLKEATR